MSARLVLGASGTGLALEARRGGATEAPVGGAPGGRRRAPSLPRALGQGRRAQSTRRPAEALLASKGAQAGGEGVERGDVGAAAPAARDVERDVVEVLQLRRRVTAPRALDLRA